MATDLRQQLQHLCTSELPPVTQLRRFGKLVKVSGLTLEVVGCQLILGQRCHIATTEKPILAEVVGFDRDITYLTPLEPLHGIFAGARVTPIAGEQQIHGGVRRPFARDTVNFHVNGQRCAVTRSR